MNDPTHPYRFSLRTLLVVVTVCAIASFFIGQPEFAEVQLFVAEAVAVACVPAVRIVIVVTGITILALAIICHAAPRATKYLTVTAIMGLLTTSMVSSYVAECRRESRRLDCIHQSRCLGMTWTWEGELFPRQNREFDEFGDLHSQARRLRAKRAAALGEWPAPAVRGESR